MYGVSPAYFLSLYGEEFTCAQAAEGIALLPELGFAGWQPEIFLPDRLQEWEKGAGSDLKRRSDELGLVPTQFVAHFLLHAFESPAALATEWGIDECRRLTAVLEEWPEIRVVTVPLPGFKIDTPLFGPAWRSIYSRLSEKLAAMVAIIESSGRRCGLEVLPGALVGGSEGVCRLMDLPGLAGIGVNLDTGHFHAAAEPLALTLGRIGEAVTGTHLCDNDGVTNASLEPGAGSVEWEAFLAWARNGDYEGSWDIEIRCPAGEAEERYRRGLAFLRRLLNNES